MISMAHVAHIILEMRDKLKGQDLSFTEIAKIVGENWQDLPPREKEPCERQAQALKEKFYADLNEYKKTPQYAQYQEYLADFKAKGLLNHIIRVRSIFSILTCYRCQQEDQS